MSEVGLRPLQSVSPYLVSSAVRTGDVARVKDLLKKADLEGVLPKLNSPQSLLFALVNAPGLCHWDEIVSHYAREFGPGKYDTYGPLVYQKLMLACEKYNRPDDAILYFNEYLNTTSKHVDKDVRDTFQRILGVKKYTDFHLGLASEHKKKNWAKIESLPEQ